MKIQLAIISSACVVRFFRGAGRRRDNYTESFLDFERTRPGARHEGFITAIITVRAVKILARDSQPKNRTSGQPSERVFNYRQRIFAD